MAKATRDDPNADQIAYWNSDVALRWSAQQERLDAVFAPLTEAALDHAAPGAGQAVLDVGCGCGASVLALARRVGPKGKVTGVDVSKPMLELAAKRVGAEQHGNVELVLADAAAYPFAPGAFDLAFSRFGVMFFADPAAAFANIRGGLARGGRLVFVTWRPMKENPWFVVPLAAAQAHLPPQPPPEPNAPGPFAFADPDRVRGILAAAGFSAVEIVPHDTMMRIAGPHELAEATQFATQVGPAARALADAEPAARAAAIEAIRDELARREGPEGISFAGAVWLVSARA